MKYHVVKTMRAIFLPAIFLGFPGKFIYHLCSAMGARDGDRKSLPRCFIGRIDGITTEIAVETPFFFEWNGHGKCREFPDFHENEF